MVFPRQNTSTHSCNDNLLFRLHTPVAKINYNTTQHGSSVYKFIVRGIGLYILSFAQNFMFQGASIYTIVHEMGQTVMIKPDNINFTHKNVN